MESYVFFEDDVYFDRRLELCWKAGGLNYSNNREAYFENSKNSRVQLVLGCVTARLWTSKKIKVERNSFQYSAFLRKYHLTKSEKAIWYIDSLK